MNSELKFEMSDEDHARTINKESLGLPEAQPVDDAIVPEAMLKLLEEIVEVNLSHKKDRLLFTFQAFSFEPGEYDADALRPDEIYRDKESISVLHTELRGERLKEFFVGAKEKGWDVTLCSRVEYQGYNLFASGNHLKYVHHIPMIDFNCKPGAAILDEAVQKNVLEAAGLGSMMGDFAYFASGRSFHGYGIDLIKQEELVPFLGKLLLLNMPECVDIVDQRWVGHRLVKGYAALRWTKNNPKYLQVPTEIECPF